MKPFEYPITPMLGLRPAIKSIRNKPFLIQAIGAYPYEDTLQTIDQEVILNLANELNCVFPFPQIFVGINQIILCTMNQIWELVNGSPVQKLLNLDVGTTWEMVDFENYVWLTNGQTSVVKDDVTRAWRVATELPTGTWVLNYNGQILLGSPNTPFLTDLATPPSEEDITRISRTTIEGDARVTISGDDREVIP